MMTRTPTTLPQQKKTEITLMPNFTIHRILFVYRVKYVYFRIYYDNGIYTTYIRYYINIFIVFLEKIF